ncbi:MAG: competence protein ComK [Candidatus Izemoplasma sp.]
MNYLTRTNDGIVISENSKILNVNSSLKYTINSLCKKNLSTMNGRIDSVKTIFGFKSLIPIYIDNSTLLFPTASLRDYDIYFINYNEILFLVKKVDYLLITFKDLSILKLYISFTKMNKQMERCKIINDYLNI